MSQITESLPDRILRALAKLDPDTLQDTLADIKKNFKSQSPLYLVGQENSIPITGIFKNSDFTFLDVETTGVNKEEDKVTEVAGIRFNRGEVSVFHRMVDPGREIPAGASALTGIRNYHVKGKPSLDDIKDDLLNFMADSQPVAHNAKFDSAFLHFIEKPWLCTLRLARHLFPDAPDHKNATLFTWFDPEQNPPGEGRLEAHRALDDVIMSIENLKYIAHKAENELSIHSFEELLQKCNEPIPVAVMPMGKHKDKSLSEVPIDFLHWAIFKEGGGMKDRLIDDHDLAYALCAEYLNKGGRITPGHWILENPYAIGFSGDKKSEVKTQPEQSTAPSDIMPFGKHKGLALKEVPVDYLEWAVRESKFMDLGVLKLAESEILKRPRTSRPKINF